MIRLAFFALMVNFVTSVGILGQSCNELKAMIDKTYGFKPSKLTEAQKDTKSSEMDQVWNLVDRNSKGLLPCVRSEIDTRKGDSFFRFDASNLLFKHDQSVETKKLMVETYSGADLADISHRYWLPYMARFGKEGLDVTKAGDAWIRFPDPGYYLPRHGTRPVDRAIGALAIYGSMDESIATPALAKLAAEGNTDVRDIAIRILVDQATPESVRAVLGLASKFPAPLSARLKQDVTKPKLIEPRQGKPTTSRPEFLKALTELVDGRPGAFERHTVTVPDGEKDIVVVMTTADLPLIRKARRHYAANATPEMPEWYSVFTQIINTILAKSEARRN